MAGGKCNSDGSAAHSAEAHKLCEFEFVCPQLAPTSNQSFTLDSSFCLSRADSQFAFKCNQQRK